MRACLVVIAALGAAAAAVAYTPITTKTIDETLVACLRFEGQYADVGKYMEELVAVVGHNAAGSYMALYYDGPEAPVHDVEVCVPVKEPVEEGNVTSRMLAGGTYARTVHLGPYENLADTWMRLGSFVHMNDLAAAEGEGIEVYLAHDFTNPANNVTEVMMPVSRPVEAVMEATGPSSRVVHFELPADDPARAVAFYGNAFGWKIEQYGETDYWLCMTGTGLGIDGAIYKRAAPTDVTRNALDVENLDAAVAAVEAAGGKIVQPRMAVTGVGWLAYAADTEGNVFGMMEADPQAK
jgi:predicted enzyme related to lactoylglutathione lyase/effector-binding domain-containing protein